jgi:DNA polymerase bacteriophage-type
MNSAPVLHIDFETRSPVDLKVNGLMRYARDPRTEVLMMAWAFNDEPAQLWLPGAPLPEKVRAHVEHQGIVVAHNAQFELAIWNCVAVKRHGWPLLKIEQVRCTMAMAYSMALPGSLEDVANAIGLHVKKDNAGRTLMLKMCKPKSFVGDTPVYLDSPDMREALGEYCMQDVVVEQAVWKRLLPMTDTEQQVWALDQYINLRGIPVDIASVTAALEVADIEKERLDKLMAEVTDGAVTACSALPALKEWAADFGVMPDGLSKAEVNELIAEEGLPDEVEAALKLRQSAGRFTSISKLKAIQKREIGARVHFAFQYHAATTGRWAGRGIQPHNFTRDLPKPHEVEEILAAIRDGRPDAIRWVDMMYDEPSIMISKCLRGFIHAGPGQTLLGGDFSNVEGRGIAWLAGEDWKVEAFRECDHDKKLPDMYKRAYAKTFGGDPAKVTKEQRQIGKVEELAFGYQGGVGAFRTMGKAARILVVKEITPQLVAKAKAMGGQIVTESEADEFKRGWRAAHSKVVQYWYDLEARAIHAVLNPGVVTFAGAHGREVRFRKYGSFLWCRLPSGRSLCYPYPEVRLDPVHGRQVLTFKGAPDATVWAIYTNWATADKQFGKPNPTYIVDDPNNSRSWCRMSTYGGKLAENITQAVCRDILAEAMLRVEAAGFKVVVHVHDEILVEGVYSENDLQRFQSLMTEVPSWAKDFPIAAGCWRSPRYMKDD